jgi:NAD(P)-dependent dehydrogenase (short-subunit alcohol dehydrogenase family)
MARPQKKGREILMSNTSNHRPVALVTGSSSGFGLLASIALAQEGYRVIATMRNPSPTNQEQLAAKAREKGVWEQIEVAALDVTDHVQIAEVVADVVQRYGRIDLLLNNAGYAAGGFIEEVSLDLWREQFETNFFGVVAVTQAVLPHMRQARSGMILTLSSISGLFGFPSMGPYVASKHAVEGFCESLRLEMLPYSVKVVLVEPGAYKTDIWKKSLGQVEQQKAEYSPYAKQMESVTRAVERSASGAGDPQEVIEQIVRIVRMRDPQLRYMVGKGTRMTVLLKNILPWLWIEKVVRRQVGW